MKRRIAIVLTLLAVAVCIYGFMPGAKAWPRGAWDAADHNRDGQLTRSEMEEFAQQASHRSAPRLMWHFDNADTNGDNIVDAAEVNVYGTAIGSKDPNNHMPPPK